MGNEVMYQSFEWYLEDDGKFFSKLKDEIKDLKNSGIDAIWLPPVLKLHPLMMLVMGFMIFTTSENLTKRIS